jgi:CRISPR-associated protein Cas1
MLNEFAYCPRLAYLEWVQGEFADNLETIEGRFGHRRVDRPSTKNLAEPSDDGPADEGDDADTSPEVETLAAKISMPFSAVEACHTTT